MSNETSEIPSFVMNAIAVTGRRYNCEILEGRGQKFLPQVECGHKKIKKKKFPQYHDGCGPAGIRNKSVFGYVADNN
jgi:hypothetical protein